MDSSVIVPLSSVLSAFGCPSLEVQPPIWLFSEPSQVDSSKQSLLADSEVPLRVFFRTKHILFLVHWTTIVYFSLWIESVFAPSFSKIFSQSKFCYQLTLSSTAFFNHSLIISNYCSLLFSILVLLMYSRLFWSCKEVIIIYFLESINIKSNTRLTYFCLNIGCYEGLLPP